ncbi:hypothetical protein H6F41_16680 [Pseudanabaena sp. FACHB-723]|uniref:DNA-binding protein n=1 Tax=Pseudanabaena mucicola FACHB-723 TaxID=2692860 RepID=A0ABR8A0Y0_9CYAN|nr:hypothetical protein [Pseudanabaena mucicola FACHB-723]
MAYLAFFRRDYWKVAGEVKRISVSAYAKKYKYSEATVRKYCDRGKIYALKFRGRWLIADKPVGD